MCRLEHRSVSSGSFCRPESLFTAEGGDGFGIDGPSFISILHATASPRLNGMLVECFGPDGVNLEPYNLVGSGPVKIIGTLNNNFPLTNACTHLWGSSHSCLLESRLSIPSWTKIKKRKDIHVIHATMTSLEAFVALSVLLDALSSCVYVCSSEHSAVLLPFHCIG